MSVPAATSRYRELQRAGRCGHCGRRPPRGRSVCDVCLAMASQRLRTGTSRGWQLRLWEMSIARLLRAVPKAKRGWRRIRTDDPHFMSPEWFLSLRFDVDKIDKQRPHFWFLQQVYWQTRHDVIGFGWRMPRPLTSSSQSSWNGRESKVAAEYERRLARLGIGTSDADEPEYEWPLPRQPAFHEPIDEDIQAAPLRRAA